MLTTRRPLIAAALVLALGSLRPGTASAALGGAASTVEADRVSIQGALMRITRVDSYSLHELRSATGTLIREYVSPSGVVFGVAWQGPFTPDLRQVLGDHFDHFQRSMQAAPHARRNRGVVAIDERDLVVHISGHQRSFYGRAYLPALVPQGMAAEAIR